MARHGKSKRLRQKSAQWRKRIKPRIFPKQIKSSFTVKRQRAGISNAQLERGLRVLSETKDINLAARSIHVSPERFKRAAKRRRAIRKLRRLWIIVKRLPRRMPIFSGGKQLAITVNNKSASLIASYLSAVGWFLRTNDPKFLAKFVGRSVKDVSGKIHVFETNPNVLYRLSSAGGEPFEQVYRIVL